MKGNVVLNLFMALVVILVFSSVVVYMNTEITSMIAGGTLNTMDETLLRLLPTAIIFTIFAGIIGGKLAEGL